MITPLVLYRLRGRENKGSMRNRTPANSQSYFSILLVYGLVQPYFSLLRREFKMHFDVKATMKKPESIITCLTDFYGFQ